MSGIFIHGEGRMGSALSELIDLGDMSATGLSVAPSLSAADVVVDYSHPEATSSLLDELETTSKPLLVGTTGLSDPLRERLRELASRQPVVIAPNTGAGIAVLATLVDNAVKALGPGWDVEVLEMHHRAKVDAPSGTAWMLLEQAAQGAGAPVHTSRDSAVAARVGETGSRSDSEIGIQSLRGGDVVGEHTVYLIGHGERIELTHRCWDRSTFARGGLRVARWLVDPERTPGLYTMADVLRG
jgi:4-hydroxy-tetrahydrodipicolinate reductase